MSEYVAGNIFMRTPSHPLQKGEVVDSHAHNFDHVTFITSGSALIEQLDGKDGKVIQTTEKAAYALKNWVLIPKGVWHRITALEGHTIYTCVYSHRRYHAGDLNDDGCVVEEYTGWLKAVT